MTTEKIKAIVLWDKKNSWAFIWSKITTLTFAWYSFHLKFTQFNIFFALNLRIKYEDKNKCVMRTISFVGFDSTEEHKSYLIDILFISMWLKPATETISTFDGLPEQHNDDVLIESTKGNHNYKVYLVQWL